MLGIFKYSTAVLSLLPWQIAIIWQGKNIWHLCNTFDLMLGIFKYSTAILSLLPWQIIWQEGRPRKFFFGPCFHSWNGVKTPNFFLRSHMHALTPVSRSRQVLPNWVRITKEIMGSWSMQPWSCAKAILNLGPRAIHHVVVLMDQLVDLLSSEINPKISMSS